MSANKQQKERDKAIRHLFEFIERSDELSSSFETMVSQLMRPVAQHFDEDVQHVTDRLLDGDYGGMAYGFLMELMSVTRWDNHKETPVDEYLKQRGWREGPAGRRYLRALNDSSFDFLEVTDVEPGRWVEVRPQGSQLQPLRIVEHSASQALHRYDVIIARLVTLGKNKRLGGILPLKPDSVCYLREQIDSVPGDLKQWYEEAVGEDGPEGLVENFADEIPFLRQERIIEDGFMCWAIDVMEPPDNRALQFHNTDDEPIVPTKFRFPITGNAQPIAEWLTAHADMIEDSDTQWSWIKNDDMNTVLGRFMLGEDSLELETNSVERGTRGVSLVQALLDDQLLGTPIGVHESIDDLVDDMLSAPLRGSLNAASASPEAQAMLQEVLQGHYRKTLDEAIPMLDGDSPRSCAADPAKHDKVVAWLKYLENSDSKSPNPLQDFSWMWEELGLSQYR